MRITYKKKGDKYIRKCEIELEDVVKVVVNLGLIIMLGLLTFVCILGSI